MANCDLLDVPIYLLHKKINFLRRIQDIKNSFAPFDPYNPYTSYGYSNGPYGTYGSYYDSYSNKYNSLYPYNAYNSYSTSHPDYTQQIIQNRLSKRDTGRKSAHKNYELLTNMKD